MNNNHTNDESNQMEESAKRFIESNESKESVNVTPAAIPKVDKSLGKAQTFDNNDRHLMAELGMKSIPLENLPSGGIFYPPGTQIAIRAASVAEIRHWSTIDENDLMGVDDVLNFVIERCCNVKMPGRMSNWKDIKEIDRFYILFAIKEFTFKDGENKIYINSDDGEKIEVRKEMISYFKLDPSLEKYYDHGNNCFSFNLPSGETVHAHMPSIGVSQFIKNYIKAKSQAGAKYDQAFVKVAPFIFNDWRILNQQMYERAVQESNMWDLKIISLYSKVTDLIGNSVDLKVNYQNKNGVESTAPLNIEGGIKSIFIVSNILDELV